LNGSYVDNSFNFCGDCDHDGDAGDHGGDAGDHGGDAGDHDDDGFD